MFKMNRHYKRFKIVINLIKKNKRIVMLMILKAFLKVHQMLKKVIKINK